MQSSTSAGRTLRRELANRSTRRLRDRARWAVDAPGGMAFAPFAPETVLGTAPWEPPMRATSLGLPLLAWFLAMFCLGSGVATAPGARAQGTVTPPAGQSRLTAPGGRRGKAARSRRIHRH